MISDAQKRKRIKTTKRILSKFIIYIILIMLGIIFAGPFIWLLSTSFKSGQNIYDFQLFPSPPTLFNYHGVVDFMNIPMYFANTVILTLSGIAIDVVFSSLCAYPLAKMNFYGQKIVTGALIATMILPAAAGMVVNYLTVSHLQLLHTYLAVIVTSSVSVFSIILLRQSYYGIPNEILEAARIDGASEVKIWYEIMVPEVMPAVSTVVILDFVSKWNNFLWPTIVLDPDQYPLAAALKFLGGQFAYNFGYIAAGTVISIIPTIIVFVAFQKYFIQTITGAVKG